MRRRPSVFERGWFTALLVILLIIALAVAVLMMLYPDLFDKLKGRGKPKPPPIPGLGRAVLLHLVPQSSG
ncbi:hypothetical protein DRP77_07685 [Candidatus Poribacteria bacterium]|nr:MAG: hypothetical protein DRP77_07685 [Candidatus Poribacteria bacterium]